jgi:pimeloyl-ACP methyl ester carboxylesterase
MASTNANGITIEYESRGEGPAVLCIMGLGAQLTAWPPDLIDRLTASGHRVICMDNRDIGLSTEMSGEPPTKVALARSVLTRKPATATYQLSDMADDSAGLLDGLGIESAHVIGASMGGMIAQTMAIDHPDKVASLTSIMSNPGDRRSGSMTASMLKFQAQRPRPTLANAVDLAVQSYTRIGGPHTDPADLRPRAERSVERSFRPLGMARQTAAIMASPDRTEALRSLDMPTLVIHGILDELVKPSGGIATANAVPNARLLMFPDMAHDLPAPRIDEIADAMLTNFARANRHEPAPA